MSREFEDDLHVAILAKDIASIKTLLAEGVDAQALFKRHSLSTVHHAVFVNSVEIVSLLLDHGAEVNARNVAGYTPLHWAARAGKMACARLLLERGADLDAVSNKGETVVDMAIEGGTLGVDNANEEMIKMLRNHPAAQEKIKKEKEDATRRCHEENIRRLDILVPRRKRL